MSTDEPVPPSPLESFLQEFSYEPGKRTIHTLETVTGEPRKIAHIEITGEGRAWALTYDQLDPLQVEYALKARELLRKMGEKYWESDHAAQNLRNHSAHLLELADKIDNGKNGPVSPGMTRVTREPEAYKTEMYARPASDLINDPSVPRKLKGPLSSYLRHTKKIGDVVKKAGEDNHYAPVSILVKVLLGKLGLGHDGSVMSEDEQRKYMDGWLEGKPYKDNFSGPGYNPLGHVNPEDVTIEGFMSHPKLRRYKARILDVCAKNGHSTLADLQKAWLPAYKNAGVTTYNVMRDIARRELGIELATR